MLALYLWQVCLPTMRIGRLRRRLAGALLQPENGGIVAVSGSSTSKSPLFLRITNLANADMNPGER